MHACACLLSMHACHASMHACHLPRARAQLVTTQHTHSGPLVGGCNACSYAVNELQDLGPLYGRATTLRNQHAATPGFDLRINFQHTLQPMSRTTTLQADHLLLCGAPLCDGLGPCNCFSTSRSSERTLQLPAASVICDCACLISSEQCKDADGYPCVCPP